MPLGELKKESGEPGGRLAMPVLRREPSCVIKRKTSGGA